MFRKILLKSVCTAPYCVVSPFYSSLLVINLAGSVMPAVFFRPAPRVLNQIAAAASELKSVENSTRPNSFGPPRGDQDKRRFAASDGLASRDVRAKWLQGGCGAESVGRTRAIQARTAVQPKAPSGIVHRLSMLSAHRTKPARILGNLLPTRA